jgi:hypothetical protein
MENNKMDKHCLITNIDNGGVTVVVAEDMRKIDWNKRYDD